MFKKIFDFFKTINLIYQRISSVESRITNLEAEFEKDKATLGNHLQNYHVDVQKKDLHYIYNCLFGFHEFPPRPYCPHCHDADHKLISSRLIPWNANEFQVYCYHCHWICNLPKDQYQQIINMQKKLISSSCESAREKS